MPLPATPPEPVAIGEPLLQPKAGTNSSAMVAREILTYMQ
jgi:hypothetical protein